MLAQLAMIVTTVIVLYVLYKVGARVYRKRQRSKALDGDYGKETQWASELVDEGDQLFTVAVSEMPNAELRDCGIIAESKEELREVVVERFEEDYA